MLLGKNFQRCNKMFKKQLIKKYLVFATYSSLMVYSGAYFKKISGNFSLK